MNIEELAFKNYYELINIQKIDLLLIIEFLQKDRKEWINQFTKTHNESIEIQKENQKLKKQLKHMQKIQCIFLGTGRKRKMEELEEEKAYNDWLKKRLEEKNNLCIDFQLVILKKYNQQKEFIKYLEDMLDDENDIFSVVRVKDALQKYREIIGDDK